MFRRVFVAEHLDGHTRRPINHRIEIDPVADRGARSVSHVEVVEEAARNRRADLLKVGHLVINRPAHDGVRHQDWRAQRDRRRAVRPFLFFDDPARFAAGMGIQHTQELGNAVAVQVGLHIGHHHPIAALAIVALAVLQQGRGVALTLLHADGAIIANLVNVILRQPQFPQVRSCDALAIATKRSLVDVAGQRRKQHILGRDGVHHDLLALAGRGNGSAEGLRQGMARCRVNIRGRVRLHVNIEGDALLIGGHGGGGNLLGSPRRDGLGTALAGLVNVHRDRAEAARERILDGPIERLEALILAHEHMRHVVGGFLRPLLVLGRQRRELHYGVTGGEYPHHSGHQAFNGVRKLAGDNLGLAFLLVARGVAVVIVERPLTYRR